MLKSRIYSFFVLGVIFGCFLILLASMAGCESQHVEGGSTAHEKQSYATKDDTNTDDSQQVQEITTIHKDGSKTILRSGSADSVAKLPPMVITNEKTATTQPSGDAVGTKDVNLGAGGSGKGANAIGSFYTKNQEEPFPHAVLLGFVFFGLAGIAGWVAYSKASQWAIVIGIGFGVLGTLTFLMPGIVIFLAIIAGILAAWLIYIHWIKGKLILQTDANKQILAGSNAAIETVAALSPTVTDSVKRAMQSKHLDAAHKVISQAEGKP